MRARISRFDGQMIGGATSRGSGVFAAFDWKDMVLGRTGEPIARKAARSSPHLKDFDVMDRNPLTKVLGHYSDVQSANSEDTVTWSVFSGSGSEPWLNAILARAFGSVERPTEWKLDFWNRTAHPDTGSVDCGPEADILISAPGWYYVVEAKWCRDLDRNQGRKRNVTQLEMRHLQVVSAKVAPDRCGVLVIAPQPERYPALAKAGCVFTKYFADSVNGYSRTAAAETMNAACVMWEEIEQILRQSGKQDRADYLRWRIQMLPVRRKRYTQRLPTYPDA